MMGAALRDTPAGRMVTANDIARAVAFLASDASEMIVGQTIVVDGVFHGFDGIVQNSAATLRFRESMFTVMREALAAPS